MLFGYESPGANALGWLAEKSLKPEVLDMYNKAEQLTKIQWEVMFITLIQIGTMGIVAVALVKVFGMKEVATLCLWLTVVEMVATVIQAVRI